MTVKKLLCFLLASAMVFSTFGCGEQQSGTEPTEELPPVVDVEAAYEKLEQDYAQLLANAGGREALESMFPQDGGIHLFYDDVLDLSQAPYSAGSNTKVSVESLTVESFQVGSQEKDTAVVRYDRKTNRLYATGVGTATLNVGDKTYPVTVLKATISMFLITGHSQSAGVGGDPSKSVVCPAGQVYSTYESWIHEGLDWVKEKNEMVPLLDIDVNGWQKDWSFSEMESADLQGMGLGKFTEKRPTNVDALIPGGTGNFGAGSGLAYRWNQLTGEKVWVINAGHGGTGINEWIRGGVDYIHGTKLFQNAQQVMKNEIAAGHYALNRMELFYFSAANGDQDWEVKTYYNTLVGMWNSFKNELATDMDADGKEETLCAMGIVPHWRPAGSDFVDQQFNNAQAVNYMMAADAGYPDVYIASNFCRGFADRKALVAFNKNGNFSYTTQGGVDPVELRPAAIKGTSAMSLFPDSIHLSQAGHNAQGFTMAEGLYKYLNCDVSDLAVRLYEENGRTVYKDNRKIYSGEKILAVPYIEPAVCANWTFEASEGMELIAPQLTGVESTQEGFLKVRNAAGKLLYRVVFNYK